MRLAHNGFAPAFQAGFSGFDSHQPLLMEDYQVKAELEELFFNTPFDFEKVFKRLLFGGFDSYKDYVMYGDLFEQLRINEKSLDRSEVKAVEMLSDETKTTKAEFKAALDGLW